MQELSDEDVFGAQKEFSDAEIFGSAAQPNTQPNTSGVGFVPQAIMGMNEKVGEFLDPIARLVETGFTAPGQAAGNLIRSYQGRPQEPLFDLLTDATKKPGLTHELTDAAQYYPPTNMAERLGRRTGQEVGNALPIIAGFTGGAIQSSAMPVKELITEGVFPAVRQAVREGANVIRGNPALTSAGEAVASFFSGGGAGIANEISPGNQGAEMAGQFFGGITPAVVANTIPVQAFRYGGKMVGKAASLLTSSGRESAAQEIERQGTQRAREQVAKAIGEEMTPASVDKLKETDALRKQIGPEYNPTLAQAAESVPLARQQEMLNNRLSGADLNQQLMREQASQQAVGKFAEKVAPGKPFDAQFVVDITNGRITSLSGKLDSGVNRSGRQREGLASNLPTINKRVTGENLRGALNAAKKAKSREMSELADNLGINSTRTPIPLEELKNRIKNNSVIMPPSPMADQENIPAAVTKTLRLTLKDFKGEPTFQDIKALRERIGDDWRDAMASTKDRSKTVRSLEALKEEVDIFIDDAFANTNPQIAQNYKQFRDTYRTEYISPFEEGAAFKIRQQDGTGFYRIPDEQVAESFFSAGDISGARQFKKIFGTAQDSAMESVALDSLRGAAVRDGIINEKAVQTWLRNHDSVLNEFPNLKQKIQNIDAINNSITQRQQQLAVRQKQLENTQLAKELGKYMKGSPPEQVIDHAIANPVLMRQIVRTMNRGGGEYAALTRNVWNRVSQGTPEEIERFITDNSRSLGLVFSKEHLNNLRTIQTARRKLDFTRPTTGISVQSDVAKNIKSQTGFDTRALAAAGINIKRGRSEWKAESANLLVRYLSARKGINQDEAFRQALNDPRVARDMVLLLDTKDKSTLGQKVARDLQRRLFRAGVGTAIRSPLLILDTDDPQIKNSKRSR